MSLFKILMRSANRRLQKRKGAACSTNNAAGKRAHRQKVGRHVVAWAAAVMLMLGTTTAMAQRVCSGGSQYAYGQSVDFGTLTVPSTLPVGAIIATQQSAPYPTSPPYVGCIVNAVVFGSAGNDQDSFMILAPGFTDVYTNTAHGMAPGIGIRITINTSTGSYVIKKGGTAGISGTIDALQSSFTVELIKVAENVGPGKALPIVSASDGLESVASPTYGALLVGSSPGAIAPVTPTCSVATPSIMVPLGKIPAKDFHGVGAPSPASQQFDINLNCTGVSNNTPISIYTTLTDATNPTNRGDVLSLSADSTATGVGIQVVKQDGTLVQYGPDSAVAGNPNQWFAGTATAEGQFTIPLTARYVQTLPTIAPGSANAVATFTMSYQ